MITDFQYTVSLSQRLLHFIILSIGRCYLIRDFFDIAVRIQQIDQFTVDLRHITVDLIDIELCRIGNVFICQLAVFPNAPEQADNKPIKTRKTGVPSRSDVSFILRIRTLCSILRFPFCQRFISASTPPFFCLQSDCRTPHLTAQLRQSFYTHGIYLQLCSL